MFGTKVTYTLHVLIVALLIEIMRYSWTTPAVKQCPVCECRMATPEVTIEPTTTFKFVTTTSPSTTELAEASVNQPQVPPSVNQSLNEGSAAGSEQAPPTTKIENSSHEDLSATFVPPPAPTQWLNPDTNAQSVIHQGRPPVLHVQPFSEVSGAMPVLSIVQPLFRMQKGMAFHNESRDTTEGFVLAIPSDTTRICVDVGTYIHSPSSRKWWSSDNKTFVIALEANPFSQALMTRFSHPSFLQHVSGYWPASHGGVVSAHNPNETFRCSGQELSECVLRTWQHITLNYHRFLLLPCAAGGHQGMASFQLGVPGRPDSGSLLNFKPAYKRKKSIRRVDWVLTAIAKLADVLRYVPAIIPGSSTPLIWDTLKIDAQGFDAAVVSGADEWISHFACVIGEFDTSAYAKAPKIDHIAILVHKYGFIPIAGGNIFMNRRYMDQILGYKILCSASDVKLSMNKARRAFGRFGLLTDKPTG